MKTFTAQQIVTAAKFYYNEKVATAHNAQGLDTAFNAFIACINATEKTYGIQPLGMIERFNLLFEAESREDDDKLACFAAAYLEDEIIQRMEEANDTENFIGRISAVKLLLGTINTLREMLETFAAAE